MNKLTRNNSIFEEKWWFLTKKVCSSNNYSYLCIVSSSRASLQCLNRLGFFILRLWQKEILMTAERTGDIYWLTNASHFHNQNIFSNSMAMLSKEYEHSTEDFIGHFKRTYTEPFPPAWILGELLPMGSVNMYYRNLKDKTLKKIWVLLVFLKDGNKSHCGNKMYEPYGIL